MLYLVVCVVIGILFQSLDANPVKREQSKKDAELPEEKTRYEYFHEDNDITRPKVPKPQSRMNVHIPPTYRWPGATIPYYISNDYTDSEKQVIAKAMKNIESVTCVRFKPWANGDRDYIYITPDYQGPKTCYSYVGRQGGQQIVKMQYDCVRDSAMTHELIHAIGFGHENQRPDALKYIKLYKDNIIPYEYERSYKPYSATEYTTNGKPYDFASIMHYPDYAYVKPELPRGTKAFVTINPPNLDMSREPLKMSPGDIAMIKQYYFCP